MDGIDNPDHGRSLYKSGMHVVERPFDPDKAQHVSSVAPEGGPIFPAVEDVQISSVPT